ncbi:hypothetical protein GJ496_011780 [Pomphorhynchus laevis]|nr:hypothetical protein GJ496_011780 [Pomphorhynchus laevis]
MSSIPSLVLGDFNIRIDSPSSTDSIRFINILSNYNYKLISTALTHILGGALDIIAVPDHFAAYTSLSISDPGLSDHFLITLDLTRNHTPPHTPTILRRPWRNLDLSLLRSALLKSSLSLPTITYSSHHDLAFLFDSELTSTLDIILPFKSHPHRRLHRAPWFDIQCLLSKRRLRHTFRVYHRSLRRDFRSITPSFRDSYLALRRSHLNLLRTKCNSFWQHKIITLFNSKTL